MKLLRTSRNVCLVIVCTLTAALTVGVPASAAVPTPTSPSTSTPLTNLAHLNFLTDSVGVADTTAHSTFHLATEPTVGVLWVYADARPGGTFERVGGGAHNTANNHWGQGSFDADDIARAAIVYLRQWKAGDLRAEHRAYEQLRGLAYLQTRTGPHAGETVLWMQPDGTLNPTPTPADSPNPSDSGASYWLARSLWAFGEGYAAFQHSDPPFAAFLKSRMDLAVAALQRDVLGAYGTYQTIHGVRVPAWLIVNGADASSEAMLGLAAYLQAQVPARDIASRRAHTALTELVAGVQQMSAGTTTTWPYRAVLPSALSRSDWHAWGAQMPAGLAEAAVALRDRSLLPAAVGDAAGFTPHLLTATGPDNGWLPTPVDGTQIAYGADARVQSLMAVASVSHRPGLRTLAGIAAGWFFGQNTSGAAVYDPATGVTNDGVAADGTVNQGSGAESTIHGLLTMQLLDANPDVAAVAHAAAHIRSRDGQSVVEAESGSLTGPAAITEPLAPGTGESQWSGSYVAAGPGSIISWSLPASSQPRLVQPVVELTPHSTARSHFTAGGRVLGDVRFGAVGAPGNAPSPTELLPVALAVPAPARAVTVTDTTRGGTGNIDALLIIPLISTLTLTGNGHTVELLDSVAPEARTSPVNLTGAEQLTARSYDRNGRLVRSVTCRSGTTALVLAGGFTVVTQ